MAWKVFLVILTELLISKVTSSYLQPYSHSPYAIQDPRSQSSYTDYLSYYYPNYAPKVTQPTYRAETLTPVKRPTEYRQKAAESISPVVQRPVEFRPAMYPAVTPAVPPPIELQPNSYQKPVEFVSPGIQRAVEFRPNFQQSPEPTPTAPIYQQAAELVSPAMPAVEYRSYQNISPKIPTPIEYYQPAYQKVAEFVAQHGSEVNKPLRHTSSDIAVPKLQSTQTRLPSSAIELLKALTTPKSECSPQLPILTSLESIKSLGFSKSDSLTPKSCSDTLDTDVLNNLAIALQLLIVNNIINHPRSESVDSTSNLSDSLLEMVYPSELPGSNPYSLTSQCPCQMSNAKFLGSSNLGDDGIMSKGILGLGTFVSGFPAPRPGVNLMSPYDAIASSSMSPFSESTPSLFSLKKDFQSPYAAIIAADNDKNLFSMSDLF